ncbi:hypothetical protein [Bifidobacterium vansinderenii]|uniref:Uncharacterized protein n=1 Tax=Bifidobacterium vansinderenii TaxID=1984871 RepID=A0A229VZ74_9BIFI|nr:hypothetical protein [Bifidobacterium vansinderenii]OXN00924.1 hypothetical protein Tam10B_0880 [Bifidobacterium vansinderenii]
MDLEIYGRYDDAFSHLFLIGLASILEDSDEQRTCMVWWKERGKAIIRPGDDLSWEDCAEIVQAHARRWWESSWLNASDVYSETKKAAKQAKNAVAAERATLSPRLGTPSSPDKWRLLECNRAQAIDALQTVLDHRYIGALGEPSYWSGDMTANGYTPDRGATRWEMVARNRGQEFITGRLRPLAEAVASRDLPQIEVGLRGQKTVDETGKNKSDSRTPTGLRNPSITDNAQAWCALFGVSAFPVMKSTTNKRGSTAAFSQISGQNPFAVLPIWLSPWTLDRYRTVVRSRALLTIGLDEAFRNSMLDDIEEFRIRSGITAVTVRKERQWLKDKGVEYCMMFPQYVSDNKSAPERWLMKGHPVFLEETGAHRER